MTETQDLEQQLLAQSHELGIDRKLRESGQRLKRETRRLDHLEAQLEVYRRRRGFDDPEPSRGR